MKSNLAKSSEDLKKKYHIHIGHIVPYKERFNELPGHIFVNQDGVFIAEYAGRRIVKFDHSFTQAEPLNCEFDKPAGFHIAEEGIWLCGPHQKKLFFYKPIGTGYQLEKELELDNVLPIWIERVPFEETYFIQAYQQRVGGGSSLWKLAAGVLSPVKSWENNKYSHLKVYDQGILLLDLSNKRLLRLDFNGNLVDSIELEWAPYENISSGFFDNQGYSFVISDNNYLYKFDAAGRLIFRSNVLLRSDFITPGGFQANIVCYQSTLFSADVRTGNIITLHI